MCNNCLECAATASSVRRLCDFGDDPLRAQNISGLFQASSGLSSENPGDAGAGSGGGSDDCSDRVPYMWHRAGEIRQYNMLISQTLARIKIDFDSAAGADADLIKINRANPQRAGAHKRWRGAVPDAEARNPDQGPRRRDAVA